eukprot:SAG31_NODE_38648_length_294_cov_1.323077_1_plen_26_part_10
MCSLKLRLDLDAGMSIKYANMWPAAG